MFLVTVRVQIRSLSTRPWSWYSPRACACTSGHIFAKQPAALVGEVQCPVKLHSAVPSERGGLMLYDATEAFEAELSSGSAEVHLSKTQ